jgi:hypothetical protein
MARSVVAGNLAISTWSRGRPERFTQVLVAALRKGSLDPEACAWLADFFENGGTGGLKFTVTRSRVGNPRQIKRTNIGAVWRFRMLTEECRTKEEAFARAKKELKIGKNRAEEYWVRIREDIAAAAEEPWKGEAYQGWKEAVAQEQIDNERGYCDWPQQDHHPFPTK